MRFIGSIVHLMGGSVQQTIIELMFSLNTVRHMLTGIAISKSSSSPHNAILVANAYHIPFTTKDTGEPKRHTASADPETYDEEKQSTGEHQGTVDVTSDITEELYDKAMLPTLCGRSCSAGVLERINRKLDYIRQTPTTRTAIPCLQYMNMVAIDSPQRLKDWQLGTAPSNRARHDAIFAGYGSTQHAIRGRIPCVESQ